MSTVPASDVDAVLAPHPPIARYFARADQKREFVKRVFDSAAGSYDRVESLMAFGSGSWYRRDALRRSGLKPGMAVLDVATGTGLVAREAATLTGDPRRVTGVDPSAGMIAQAGRHLAGRGNRPGVRLVRGRAEQLPVADDRFDFLSMGYALRHVGDLASTFREFHRVLKPGGVACVLELFNPPNKIRKTLLKWYMLGVVPCLSRLAAGNDKGTGLLWRYYWETIEACVPPEKVMSAMREAGFKQVQRVVRLGIFAEYTGTK
jgi:demethylmenaquinone methyltransferase/2-methoxy-6-polyprenyl-1,4-benzoquinol methylase